MAQKSAEIDRYLDSLPPARREALQTLRALIHAAVPATRESMAHRMPTFATADIFCSLAAQKNYMALYVCNIPVLDRHRQPFAHLNCGKSCIRFKKLEDLPLAAVRALMREAAAAPAAGRC